MVSAPLDSGSIDMTAPSYTLTRHEAGAILRLVVSLPNAASMAELDVELTADAVKIGCAAHAPLCVDLPVSVDPESDAIRAKFSKKSRSLRVDLPVCGGGAAAEPEPVVREPEPVAELAAEIEAEPAAEVEPEPVAEIEPEPKPAAPPPAFFSPATIGVAPATAVAVPPPAAVKAQPEPAAAAPAAPPPVMVEDPTEPAAPVAGAEAAAPAAAAEPEPVAAAAEPAPAPELDPGQVAVQKEMTAAAAELKRRGNIEFQRKDYRHAAELFSRAIQLEPANAVHLSNRSLALLKLERHDDALRDADALVEMRPDWGKAFFRQGAALQALKRCEEAVASFERALSLSSDDAKVKQALDQAKTALKKSIERAEALAKAKKRKEEATAREAARKKSGAVKDSRLDSEELTGDLARPYHGWPVCVNQNEERGRGVVAQRTLRPGEIAWQADAWCAVVSDNFVASVCATCFRVPNEEDGDMDIKCEGCGIAFYCSDKCKEESAALHKLECSCARSIVQVTQGKSDTRGARMMIRVLAQRQLEQQQGATIESECDECAPDDMKSKPIWNRTKYADVERLVSHLDTMEDKKIDSYRGIAKGVSKMPVSEGLDEDEVLQLVATLQCNSQGIVDLNHHRRGDLLIAPADINHSCAPNSFVAFHGKTVQFRTIKSIAEGEELTITYTDLYLPRDLRREKLLASHCFECACDRCTDDSPNSVDSGLSGFACLNDGCDGLVPGKSATCLTCGSRYDPSMLEGISVESTKLYEQGLKLHSERNYEGSGKKFADLVEQYGNSLYRRHTILYNSFHHLMSASNAIGNATAGASFARRAISCIEQVYPKYHSEVAMMHAALAQTEWRRFTDKPSDPGPQMASVTSFNRCLEILAVCYGKNHEAHIELTKLRDKVKAGEMRGYVHK